MAAHVCTAGEKTDGGCPVNPETAGCKDLYAGFRAEGSALVLTKIAGNSDLENLHSLPYSGAEPPQNKM